MRNKEILKNNHQECYIKNNLQKTSKRPNALYFLSSTKMIFKTNKPQKIKYIFNNMDNEKKNKSKKNRTPDNKHYIYIKKNNNTNSKTINSIFNANPGNYKFCITKKNNLNNKSFLNKNKTNNYINIKKNYSTNIFSKLNNTCSLSNYKLIKKIANINTNKNENLNLSMNGSKAWITFKKKNISKNKKNKEFLDYMNKNLYKKYNFNYNSFFYKPNFNNLTINNKNNENMNNFYYKYSIKKDITKSTKKYNYLIIKKKLKDKSKRNELNINKIYSNINTNTFSKINKKNEDIKLTKNRIKNINISSKQTIFTTYPNSEKNIISTIVSNDLLKQSKYNKKKVNNSKFNDKFILDYTIDSNGKDTPEYESKFINYDLGLPDKISSSIFTLDQNNKNKDNIKKEYEKPVEEIEKIVNQIINNSNEKIKKINRLIKINNNKNKISMDTALYNDDIEELKKGERIQKVLSLYISKKNNNQINIKKK